MATKTKSQQSDKSIPCEAGTILFREGEPGNRMYVIKSGRIRLTKKLFDTDVTIEELGAGDFCGEVALISGQTRPVTAIAVSDATVIQVEAEQFENMLRSNADIAVRMMKKMAHRLTEAHFKVTNFTLRTTRGRLMNQLRHEAMRSGDMSKPAAIPDDLADVLSIELGELKALLSELIRDELISVDKRGFFQIVDRQAYDRYLRYLELADHFQYRA